MQTQLQRAEAYDRYMDVPDMPEWTDSDINEAIEALETAIIDYNETWDEDCDYHNDFSLEVERIIKFEPRNEQLALIQDAFNKAVHDYCVSQVRRDPAKYCAMYCEA